MEHNKKPKKEDYTILEEKIFSLKKDKATLERTIKKLEGYLKKLLEQYELIDEKKAAGKIKFDKTIIIDFEEKATELEKQIELTREQCEQTDSLIEEYQERLGLAQEEGLQDLIKRVELLQEKIKINGLKLSELERLNKEIDEIYKRIEKIT
ncbi:MAG: hypothetical protein ACFFCM_02300 [Promethearchaeota archaeon]